MKNLFFNLIKYTIGLPVLLFKTVIIIAGCDKWERYIYATVSECLRSMWKPY